MSRFKKINPVKAIAVLLVAFLFTQCMHDEFQFDKLITEVEVEAGFFSPLAYGSLTISDLTNDLDSTEGLQTYPDGLLYFSFTDSLLSYISEDILTVPDQDFFQYFIEADFSFPPLWDTTTLDRIESFPFSFSNDEQIDSIYLDAGTMTFTINSDFQHTGIIVITCPNIRLDGVPFSRTILIDNPDGTFSTNQQYPLDGYVVELVDSIGSMFLPVDFHVELYREGMNPVNIGDQIEIIATITNLDFEAVFGYIGNYELLSSTDSLELPVFENNFFEGTLEFENPQLNLIVQNSFGVPVEASISRFTGFNSDGDSIPLNLDASANPILFEFPSLAEYGQTKETIWSINGTNSSISDFLEFLPSSIYYNIAASSNPATADSSYNYVSDASRIDVNLELILPIWFNTNSLALMDTMELDMGDIGENSELIKQVNILLEVANGLPVDIEFQLYFTDSLYNHVDTLFGPAQQPIVLAGQLDENDIVQYPRTKATLIQFTGDEIKNFENVRNAIFRAGLKTADYDLGTSVKIFDYYTIDFNLSIDADLKINSNDID